MKDIIKHAKDGKEAVQSGIRELEDCGLLIRTRCKDQNTGKFEGYDYYIKREFPNKEVLSSSRETRQPVPSIEGETPSLNNTNTNNNTEINNNSASENKEPWRVDFKEYQKVCRDGFNSFATDVENIDDMTKRFPNLEIIKVIKHAYATYWSTEDGWRNKKKKCKNKIDWPRTIRNVLRMEDRRVNG